MQNAPVRKNQTRNDQEIDLSELLGGGADDGQVVHRLDLTTIVYSGAVEKPNADAFVEALVATETAITEQLSSIRSICPGYQPRIRLILSTPGGDVHEALRMVDFIETSQYPVDTYATGLVASAGIFMLLSGKRRYAFPHAFFMIHDGSSGYAGEVSKFRSYAKHLDAMQGYMNSLILKHTTFEPEELRNLSRDEHWFGADEALARGLIHEVKRDRQP